MWEIIIYKTHKIKNESDNRRLKVSENKVLYFL